MKINHTILFFMFMLLGNYALGQMVVNGDDGKKIVIYPDGTWEPYERTGPNSRRSLYMPDSLELVKNFAELDAARKVEKGISLRLIRKRMEVATLQGELSGLEENAGVAEQVVFDQRNKIMAAKNVGAVLQDSLDLAKKYAALMESMAYLSDEMRQKIIRDWKTENLPAAAPLSPSLTRSGRKSYAQYSVETDVMLNPPLPPCEFIFSGKDEASGTLRRDSRPEVLFSFTDRGLEEHFKKGELITGMVNLTSLSAGLHLLNLEIIVASKRAPSLFGGFKNGALIRFRTLEGVEIKLLNSRENGGQWDEARQGYVFRGQYPIGAKEFKLLSKSELDSVLIRWSKVQEEYQINDVDVIARQFNCLLGS